MSYLGIGARGVGSSLNPLSASSTSACDLQYNGSRCCDRGTSGQRESASTGIGICPAPGKNGGTPIGSGSITFHSGTVSPLTTTQQQRENNAAGRAFMGSMGRHF